jgi:hypothetical protein
MMIKCRPKVLDKNNDGTFSMLVFKDDYIIIVRNEGSFPTFDSIKTNLGKIKGIQVLPIEERFFVDGFITHIPRPDPYSALDENSVKHIACRVHLTTSDSTELPLKYVN